MTSLPGNFSNINLHLGKKERLNGRGWGVEIWERGGIG